MTAEQLQNARMRVWRQQGEPLLTADDAAAWLREAGIALFLPRSAQIAAPAGSFVEATAGEQNATPRPAAIENATGLLHRLLASSDAVALNLLGIPGDQPDFLVTEEALPFLFALRGDREWKRGPRGKSSPLVVEVWKLLDRDGAQSADEVKQQLGRQLTESAALRALTELWTSLRIEPIYSAGEGTRWQLLEGNHEPAMTAGSAMAQGMALSALVSLYLQSAVAATGNEIEAFLSPVASRSRIRDAVRGLTATRQLGLRNLGAHEHFYVEGSLPEFEQGSDLDDASAPGLVNEPAAAVIPDLLPEVPAPTDVIAGGFRIEALSDRETEQERTIGEGRKRFVAQRGAAFGDRKSYGDRPGGDRKTFGGERKSFGGERKTFGGAPRSGSAGKKPFFPREPWKEYRRPGSPADEADKTSRPAGDRRPYTPRESNRPAAGGDRKPFRPSAAGGDRKPFAPRADRPYAPRDGGDRKPFAPRGNRPYTPRDGGKPFSPRPGSRPSGPRPGTDGGMRPPRKPFAPRENAEAGRPFQPRADARPTRPYQAGADRKPFTPRDDAGSKRPYSPRPGAPSRPFRSPGSETRKPFSPRDAQSRPYAPKGDRPQRGGYAAPDRGSDAPRRTGAPGAEPRRFSPEDGRPPRPGAPSGPARPGGKRPRTAPFTSSGKPRAGVGKTGRPGPRSARPGTGAAKPGFAPRKPGFGPRKPGAGPRKPGGKGPRRDA